MKSNNNNNNKRELKCAHIHVGNYSLQTTFDITT